MKHHQFSARKKPAATRQAPNLEASQNEINAALCPDEVARTAYFSYVNEGCPEGRQVQHWLAAEAELTKACALTRTHAIHHHP